MIDAEGYRPNVGIIVCNHQGQLFWARRIGQKSWQFPQGGVDGDESIIDAMYRELWEETGLESTHVKIMGCTRNWLRYTVPPHLRRRRNPTRCIGQKQRWFMLRMVGEESDVCLDASDKPEFDDWCWVDYCKPVEDVIFFKRTVYARALTELSRLVYPQGLPSEYANRLERQRNYRPKPRNKAQPSNCPATDSDLSQ